MTQIVYFTQRADGDIKIGTTAHYIKRMTQLLTDHGAIDVLGTMPGGRTVEQAMHRRFAAFRRFKPSKARNYAHPLEWFAPAPELLWFVAFETQRPTPCKFHLQRQRIFVADTPRRWHKVAHGSECAPTTNKVQRMLVQRFGSLDNIKPGQLSEATRISPQTLHYWVGGYVEYAEMPTIQKWADYFGCTIEDILDYAREEIANG